MVGSVKVCDFCGTVCNIIAIHAAAVVHVGYGVVVDGGLVRAASISHAAKVNVVQEHVTVTNDFQLIHRC